MKVLALALALIFAAVPAGAAVKNSHKAPRAAKVKTRSHVKRANKASHLKRLNRARAKRVN
jgi:hypothetical protein